jgi:ATP-binding cassette, subfamily B (MDR/TAP), member 1
VVRPSAPRDFQSPYQVTDVSGLNLLNYAMLISASHIRELQLAVGLGFGNLFSDISTALANLVVALYFSWNLTLVILATAPVSATILHLLGRKIPHAIEAQKQQLASASKYATSAMMGIDLVKTFNGVDQETWQYADTINRSKQAFMSLTRAIGLQISFAKFWFEVLFIVGFYYGATLINQGADVGDILTTFYAALSAIQAIDSSVPMYLTVSKGCLAGQALQHIVINDKTDHKMKTMAVNHEPDRCGGDVVFRDVWSSPLRV